MSEEAPKDNQSKRPRSRARRVFLAVFKWTRVAVLILLLFALVLGIFLNRVGLPDWMQRRVIAQMKSRGWDIDFSRLRLRWYRGIVADDLQLSRTNAASSPHLFAETAEFRLNARALRSFNLQANSVLLAGGRLIWPVPGTNVPKQTFLLQNIRGELFFHPDDQWELRSLQARSLGAQVRIRGDITNASLIRDWKLPRKERKTPREKDRPFWHEFLTQAEKVRASVAPQIQLIFTLDARDPFSLDATAKVIAPAIESPWGAATNLSLAAQLIPPSPSNPVVQAAIKLSAEQPRTRWGVADQLELTLLTDPSFTELFPSNGMLRLELTQPRTPWGDAEHFKLHARTEPAATDSGSRHTTFSLSATQPQSQNGHARAVELTARASHAARNLLPAALQSDITLVDAQTRSATSAWTRILATVELPQRKEIQLTATNLPWPDRLANLPFEFTATFSNAHGAHLEFAHGSLTNRWRAPQLSLQAQTLSSAGSLTLNTLLDTDARQGRFNVTFRGDPHQLTPFLPTNALPWLADYQSSSPLEVQAAGSAKLPAWTNPPPDWRAILLPSLTVASRFDAGQAMYRNVNLSTAHALCLYTNAVWTLPEIRFTRPEGAVEGDAEIDGRTGDFRCQLRSSMDLQALRPLFSPRIQTRHFDLFQFAAAPLIEARIGGNLTNLAALHGTAAASVTNVTFRKQPIRFAAARASFTNEFFAIYQPLILRDGERGEADGLGFDVRAKRLYLTNAQGNIAPMAIANAIGPHVVRAIQPYVFDRPPMARVNGSVPTARGDNSEDLHFELDGGAFHWWRFHADRARASIHWQGDRLTLANVDAALCGGNARGWARFHFRRAEGDTMAFHTRLVGADLHRLVRDMQDGRSNKLEGTLNTDLTITHALLKDFKSWDGYGHAQLTNGLLWDLPLFGAASRILNAIVPGLGHSRAREGTNTFVITNSVIYSRDLKIEATAMHLKYRGTVDFDGNVDARMEADLLAGMPMFGPVVSKILWPVGKVFEYRVTGTLAQPKLDEAYFLPKVIRFPLQPIKTLKDLFGDDEADGKRKSAPP